MNYTLAFASHLRCQGRSKSTIQRHKLALAEFTAFFRSQNGKKGIIQGFQAPYLESYKEHLLKTRQLRPSTINGRLAGLSSFAQFLRGRGLIPFNPLDLVPRLHRNGTCKPSFAPCREDVQKLRQAVNHDVLDLTGRLIVEFLYTGMSVKEICNLTCQPNLCQQRSQASFPYPLHPEARLALEHYMILRPILVGDRLLVGKGPGHSIKAATVHAVLRRLSRQIGVKVTARHIRLAQFTEPLETGLRAPKAA